MPEDDHIAPDEPIPQPANKVAKDKAGKELNGEAVPEQPSTTAPPPDPTDVFNDLEALRKRQKPAVLRNELLGAVLVGAPSPDGYFRVNPDESKQWAAKIVRLKDDKNRTVYYVDPAMEDHPLLVRRLRDVLLVETYTWPARQTILWPVPMDTEGAGAPWWETARTAFETAKTRAVQMKAGEGQFEVSFAEGELPDPVWSPRNMGELLKAGFKGKYIANDEHPVMRQLRGLPG